MVSSLWVPGLALTGSPGMTNTAAYRRALPSVRPRWRAKAMSALA
jgi:hypothetical protein